MESSARYTRTLLVKQVSGQARSHDHTLTYHTCHTHLAVLLHTQTLLVGCRRGFLDEGGSTSLLSFASSVSMVMVSSFSCCSLSPPLLRRWCALTRVVSSLRVLSHSHTHSAPSLATVYTYTPHTHTHTYLLVEFYNYCQKRNILIIINE